MRKDTSKGYFGGGITDDFIGGNRAGGRLYTEGAYTDGVNGTPRTSVETRPINFTVRIWKRIA